MINHDCHRPNHCHRYDNCHRHYCHDYYNCHDHCSIIINIVIVMNIFNQDGGGSIDVEEIRDIVVGLFRFFANMIISSSQHILPIITRVTNNIMCVKIIHNM